jgi:hypothetical protein
MNTGDFIKDLVSTVVGPSERRFLRHLATELGLNPRSMKKPIKKTSPGATVHLTPSPSAPQS